MKPICAHPDYCKSDSNAVYLGQSTYLAQNEAKFGAFLGARSNVPDRMYQFEIAKVKSRSVRSAFFTQICAGPVQCHQ
jgi:hypothetical protein